MNPAKSLASLLIVAALGIPLAGCAYDGEPEVVRMHPILTLDPKDPEELVAFSDEVFVATVVSEERTDNRMDGELPRTVYSVTVVETIKGALGATTDVAIDGGVTTDGRTLYLMPGDELLDEGQTYAFAGRRASDGVLTLVSGGGAVRVDPSRDAAESHLERLVTAASTAQSNTPGTPPMVSEAKMSGAS